MIWIPYGVGRVGNLPMLDVSELGRQLDNVANWLKVTGNSGRVTADEGSEARSVLMRQDEVENRQPSSAKKNSLRHSSPIHSGMRVHNGGAS